MSDPVEIPLSATEEAFVKMVFDEHAAMVQQADRQRHARIAVLLSEKGVPTGASVTVEPRTDEAPARIVYTA